MLYQLERGYLSNTIQALDPIAFTLTTEQAAGFSAPVVTATGGVRLTVDWGDGSAEQEFYTAWTGTAFGVTLNHSYPDVTSKAVVVRTAHPTLVVGIICLSCSLTALDVSACTGLISLDCNTNSLTALDVHLNTALTSLGCGDNSLTALDVHLNTALTNLSCGNNNLTALDVHLNTALTSLRCGGNSLTALDVTANGLLTTLYCNVNALTALDVHLNTLISDLSCEDNSLNEVAVDDVLVDVEAYGTNGGEMDISGNVAPGVAGAAAKAILIAPPRNWDVITD